MDDPNAGWMVAHSSIPDILAGLPENLQDRMVDFYSVQFPFTGSTVIAAGNTPVPVDATISGDYLFAAKYITFFASQQANIVTPVAAPPLTILIEDEGSNRKLSNSPVHIMAYAGTGQLPFPMPIAKLFSANSSITVTAANLDTVNGYNLWFVLHGLKIFKQMRDGTTTPFDSSVQ
jgi:hypothetical protein